jgi:hypothetical protein
MVGRRGKTGRGGLEAEALRMIQRKDIYDIRLNMKKSVILLKSVILFRRLELCNVQEENLSKIRMIA